jgi:hypothetical protein
VALSLGHNHRALLVMLDERVLEGLEDLVQELSLKALDA